jgi:hypothetical protein
MVTLKINNQKEQLVASEDISSGTTVFVSNWFDQETKNPFYLPKSEIKIQDKPCISTDDLFTPVSLTSFGEYIKPDAQNYNTTALIDYNNKQVSFVAVKNIKKNDELVYTLNINFFPNVTIQ